MDLKLLITPSYFCNNRCPFCYLGKDRENATCVNLEKLKGLLSELAVSSDFSIKRIDLLGGELAHLDLVYVEELLKIAKNYSESCSIITSEISFAHFLANNHKDYIINLSFNFTKARPDQEILNASVVPFNVFTLDYSIKDMNKKDVLNIIRKLKFKSWRILPCSPSTHNPMDMKVDFQKVYQEYKKDWSIKGTHFVNLEESNGKNLQPIFINPNGNFSGIRFYLKDGKILKELYEFPVNSDYVKNLKLFISQKKEEVKEFQCARCVYLGKCGTLQYSKYKCNGLLHQFKEKV